MGGPGRGRRALASVPLQAALVFGGWWTAAYTLATLAVFVYKGVPPPQPPPTPARCPPFPRLGSPALPPRFVLPLPAGQFDRGFDWRPRGGLAVSRPAPCPPGA